MWYLTTHYTMSCHHKSIIKYSGVELMTSLTPSYLHTHYQSSYVISNYTLHHVMSPYSHHQILRSRADDITNAILSTHSLAGLISMANCKTVVTPLLTHRSYYSLALSHPYVICIHSLNHAMSPYSHHQVLWGRADDITNTILSTQFQSLSKH